jgi:hypothetical protein
MVEFALYGAMRLGPRRFSANAVSINNAAHTREAYLGFEPIDPVTSSKSDGSLGRAVAPALDTTAALRIPRSFPRGLFHGANSIRNSATIPTTATIAATVTGTTTPGAFFPCACNWLSL